MLAEEDDLALERVARRRELAFLVELAVIGDVGLRDDPQNAPARHHHGAVEQASLEPERRPDDEQRGPAARRPHEGCGGVQHRSEESLLLMQILQRVPGQRQLREQHDRGALPGGAGVQPFDLRRVGCGIGERHARDRHGGAHEIVRIEIEEAAFACVHARVRDPGLRAGL